MSTTTRSALSFYITAPWPERCIIIYITPRLRSDLTVRDRHPRAPGLSHRPVPRVREAMDVQERPLSRESWRDMTVEDGGGRSDRAWTAFPAPFQASAQSAAQAVQLGARALRSPKAALASLVVVLLLWLSASGRRQRQTFTTSSSGPSGPNIPTNASDPYPQLPVYALRDGTRFHRPVPPTDDPWPNNARIAREWLAADRFRRSSDSSSDQGQEEAAEYFTRPPREQYQVPAETIRRAFGVFGFSRRNWRSMRLNKGEAYNETDGRPLQIDRKDLYRGPSWWKPKKLGAAKSLPQVQKYRRDERDEEHRSMDQQRRDWVKRAFLHVWEGLCRLTVSRRPVR